MPIQNEQKALLCPIGNEITAEKGHVIKTVNQKVDMNVSRSQRTPSSTVPAKKSVSSKTTSNSPGNIVSAKGKSQKKVIARPSSEQVALRAYFIGERRRTLGIQGDETSDWVAAERELLEELKTK